METKNYDLPIEMRPPEAFGSGQSSCAVEGIGLDMWTLGWLTMSTLTNDYLTQKLSKQKEVSSWSAHIYPIMYRILKKRKFNKVTRETFPHCKLKNRTLKSARNFVANCLRIDPRNRPVASSLLHHQFLDKEGDLAEKDEIWRRKKKEKVIRKQIQAIAKDFSFEDYKHDFIDKTSKWMLKIPQSLPSLTNVLDFLKSQPQSSVKLSKSSSDTKLYSLSAEITKNESQRNMLLKKWSGPLCAEEFIRNPTFFPATSEAETPSQSSKSVPSFKTLAVDTELQTVKRKAKATSDSNLYALQEEIKKNTHSKFSSSSCNAADESLAISLDILEDTNKEVIQLSFASNSERHSSVEIMDKVKYDNDLSVATKNLEVVPFVNNLIVKSNSGIRMSPEKPTVQEKSSVMSCDRGSIETQQTDYFSYTVSTITQSGHTSTLQHSRWLSIKSISTIVHNMFNTNN